MLKGFPKGAAPEIDILVSNFSVPRLLPIFCGCRFQRVRSRKKSRFWFWTIWSPKIVFISVLVLETLVSKRKKKNNKKKTRPSKQWKYLIWILIFFVSFLSIRERKAKTATLALTLMLTLTLTFYSIVEEKGGKYSEKENIFFLEEKKNREKEKEENI